MSITYHSIIFNKIAKTYIHILMWPSWSWPVFIPLNVEEEGNLITNWSNLTTFTGLFSLKREIWFVICISLYTKMMAALQIERDMSIFSWMFNKKIILWITLFDCMSMIGEGDGWTTLPDKRSIKKREKSNYFDQKT